MAVTVVLHNVVGSRQRGDLAVETMSKRTSAEPSEAERSHVKLVDGDPPMLRLEINLVLPHGGELSDLLQWALPEQRLVICGNLRARIHEELAEVFSLLQESAG
jgi:hypothetical protein